MSDYQYRANLSAPGLPVDPLAFGRSVIIKSYDQNYAPNLASKEDTDKDIGIPQVYYIANALPTQQGFRSVTYTISQEGCPGNPYTAFAVRSSTESALLVHTEEGFIYKLVDSTPQFELIGNLDARVTYATVSGTTYLYFANLGCYKYNFAYEQSFTAAAAITLENFTYNLGVTALTVTLIPASTGIEVPITYVEVTSSTIQITGAFSVDDVIKVVADPTKSQIVNLVPVTLAGLEPSGVVGITSSGGYLIAWSADAIAWSSVFNPTDFVPSPDTGAGLGAVEGARGAITYCVSNPLGFFVFTESNCVSATLSNNAAFPFNFKEIVGSSGITDLQAVSFEGNSGSAYAYTSNGFQEIKHTGARTIWTDLNDNADVTPVWDTTTVISEGYGTARGIQSARIAVIASRFVCVSIQKGTQNGFPVFRDCWIFDNALQRWGRLVKEHFEVFETEANELALLTSEGKIAVVANTNAPTLLFNIESNVGVLVLGKYQYTRQRLSTLEGITLDNVYPVDVIDSLTEVPIGTQDTEVWVLTAADGKTGSFTQTYRKSQSEYLYHKTGINHSIMVKGNFYLSSLVLTLKNHGAR
jgi:hypothetical protein